MRGASLFRFLNCARWSSLFNSRFWQLCLLLRPNWESFGLSTRVSMRVGSGCCCWLGILLLLCPRTLARASANSITHSSLRPSHLRLMWLLFFFNPSWFLDMTLSSDLSGERGKISMKQAHGMANATPRTRRTLAWKARYRFPSAIRADRGKMILNT